MGKHKLTEAEIDKILSEITIVNTDVNDDFDAPDQVQKDSEKSGKSDIKKALEDQKPGHRNTLLWLIGGLSIGSFIFLVVIIVIQMYVRTYNPSYTGVSDIVINIITGGVFGEVIAVVAVIAKEVWKD
jgi:hypothetical protein